VSGTLETNNCDFLRDAVLRGGGLWLAPSPVVSEHLKSGALVPLLTEFLPEKYSIDALYPHRDHVPVKVRSFIDLVAKNFREATWQAMEEIDHSGTPDLAPSLQE
jgi:DNA-binding transcriptional LysR family regulator